MMFNPHYQRSPWRHVHCALALLLLVLPDTVLRAELRFAKTRVDVGEARTGMPLAQRFAFVNDGPETIEIIDIRTSCGCLTPRLGQRIYPPGASGALLLEVHTLSQTAGPHTWNAQVQYRKGDILTEVALQLSARVVAEVTVQPAALTIFADSAVAHDILLTNLRARPLAVRAVHSTSAKLAARLGEESRDKRGHPTRTIHIVVTDDFPDGRHEEAVTIATDDPAYGELKILVTVIKHARQRVAALPEQVTLTAEQGTPLPAQLVRLRDKDNQAVIVERIVPDSPAITCHWAPGPNTMATVKIMVDRSQLTGGGLHSAVHIHISQPVRETVTIPIQVDSPTRLGL